MFMIRSLTQSMEVTRTAPLAIGLFYQLQASVLQGMIIYITLSGNSVNMVDLLV